ncbi:MAG: outer membrane protein assembly factor BamE [Methylococcales bacterium]|nr:outer membrane protein assembly factor BamE [Methylococcales bacterium]MDD5753845.1 outer membrane protein assembly factor BamE [Methylococcales bacterium]
MRKSILSLSLLSASLMSCSTVLNHLPYVYTIDVNQGNMIDQTMIDQLRPNMTKRQVLYIMGSPMLVDYFHQNRWDYIYSSKKGGEDPEKKAVSIFFENDQVKGIQGDLRPSAIPIAKPSVDKVVDVPKRDLEKTLWETMTGWFGYDDNHDDVKKEVETVKPTAVTP